jgi:hypothetical protein
MKQAKLKKIKGRAKSSLMKPPPAVLIRLAGVYP